MYNKMLIEKSESSWGQTPSTNEVSIQKLDGLTQPE